MIPVCRQIQTSKSGNRSLRPSSEDLVNTLKAAYKERPESFLVYHCGTDNQSLRIEFRPTDPYLEQYENHIWTDECWDLLKEYNDLPLYRWDGKKFVK